MRTPRYPTDLTDDQWAVIEPRLPKAKPGGRPRSTDLRAVILARPQLFAELIRSLKSMPDHAVLRIVRDVRDGDW